ncbi:MAG: ribosomal RNA small subunit methyltransferase A [Myxococcales bacterium]|nr:ribosomal RNA small subunit methyltransferase A [Myxococcales bacterium]
MTMFPTAHELLAKYGLRAKKSFSQNFLTSDRVFRAIVDATVQSEMDWVVEVGAGIGTLTARLAQRAYEGKVIALERDPDMISVLRGELGQHDVVHIEPCDALAYNYEMAAKWAAGPIAVCGNLPYHIAAPLIFRIMEARAHVSRLVVMVQREMADRIVAVPDTRAYGAMSVMLQTYADVKMVAKVAAGSFVPPPKVESAVVQLTPLPEGRGRFDVDETHYHMVVHAAFAQRRKTLRNSLQSAFSGDDVAAALSQTGLDGGRRAETLNLAEFGQLAAALPDLKRTN